MRNHTQFSSENLEGGDHLRDGDESGRWILKIVNRVVRRELNGDHWQVLVNAVMNVCVPQRAGNILTILIKKDFSPQCKLLPHFPYNLSAMRQRQRMAWTKQLMGVGAKLKQLTCAGHFIRWVSCVWKIHGFRSEQLKLKKALWRNTPVSVENASNTLHPVSDHNIKGWSDPNHKNRNPLWKVSSGVNCA